MKQTAPFLPKLKMTRHLSTIVEVKDENVEEFRNMDHSSVHGGRAEYRRQRFSRRVLSCSDVTVARELTERHRVKFSLPPLPNTASAQRHALQGNTKKAKDNMISVGYDDNMFPDFKPPNRNSSILDFDAKVGRYSAKPNLNAERDFSHNKENIVASWLQFFG